MQGPGAAFGIAAAVVTLLTVAWLAVATLPPRPPVPRPSDGVLLGLSLAVALFVLLKLAADLDGLTRGAWLSVVFAAGLAGSRLAGSRLAGGRRAPVSPS